METLEERLRRVARDRKRKAEAHTEDGSREPVPEPAAPAQGSTSASATTVEPSVDVGSRDGQRKRPAEDEPDDPRLVGGGPEAELGSADIEHECATCNQKFSSRNQLHRHLRRRQHQVIDDHDTGPPGFVDSSDDENDRRERMKTARQKRQAVLHHHEGVTRHIGSRPYPIEAAAIEVMAAINWAGT